LAHLYKMHSNADLIFSSSASLTVRELFLTISPLAGFPLNIEIRKCQLYMAVPSKDITFASQQPYTT
jgi:hypothetical protein